MPLPEHVHLLDGKGRDLTIEELKEFVDHAGKNPATAKRKLHIDHAGNSSQKLDRPLKSKLTGEHDSPRPGPIGQGFVVSQTRHSIFTSPSHTA